MTERERQVRCSACTLPGVSARSYCWRCSAGLAFLTIGFVVSGFAGTVEAAGAISNVITMPMMFLSGVYFPLAGAPSWLKPIIAILPLTYLANGLRDVMEKGAAINALGLDFAALAATTLIGLGVASRTFRWE